MTNKKYRQTINFGLGALLLLKIIGNIMRRNDATRNSF